MNLFEKWIEPRKGRWHDHYFFTNHDLKLLLVPLIIEQMLSMMVGMADTVMISHAGEAAVSGVSLVDMVNGVFIYVFSALAAGGGIVVSQYLGARDDRMIHKACGQVLTACLFTGAFLMLVVSLLKKGILHMLFGQISEEVMQASLTYIRIMAISYPFLAIYHACASLFRSIGNSRLTMRVSMTANAINITGNALSVYVLHAGVRGVALASLVSWITASMIMMYVLMFRTKNSPLRIAFADLLTFDGAMLKKILGIAIPNGLESGMFQVARVTMTSIISTFGTAQIAANGVANSLDYVNGMISGAAMMAMPAIIGRCVGAGDYEQADYYLRKVLRIAQTLTTILCTCMILAVPYIIPLYHLSPETNYYIHILVVIHAVLTIVMGTPSGPFPSALRAAGDVRYSLYVALISLAIGRVFFSYVFALWMHYEIIGMWMAMGTHWTMVFLGAYIRYRSGKWKNYRLTT